MPRLLRLHHWWLGKLPPIAAVAYLAMAHSMAGFDPFQAMVRLALLFVSCFGIGGIGFLLTDAFDVKEDRLMGKENSWSALAPRARIFLVVVLVAAAWLPWLGRPHAPIVAALIATEFGLFACYAIPPVRLKERGMAGIVIDAVYAYVLPTQVAWIAFTPQPFAHDRVTPLLLAAWMLPMGMRHLACHQFDDIDRDRMAGVKTFATQQGREQTMGFILHRLLPLEAAAAAVALVWLAPTAPLLLVGFCAHCGYEYYVGRERSLAPLPPLALMTDPERQDLLGQRFLSTFVEVWLAPLALITLIGRNFGAAWLVPLHLTVIGVPLLVWWQQMRDLPAFSARAS